MGLISLKCVTKFSTNSNKAIALDGQDKNESDNATIGALQLGYHREVIFALAEVRLCAHDPACQCVMLSGPMLRSYTSP